MLRWIETTYLPREQTRRLHMLITFIQLLAFSRCSFSRAASFIMFRARENSRVSFFFQEKFFGYGSTVFGTDKFGGYEGYIDIPNL